MLVLLLGELLLLIEDVSLRGFQRHPLRVLERRLFFIGFVGNERIRQRQKAYSAYTTSVAGATNWELYSRA